MSETKESSEQKFPPHLENNLIARFQSACDEIADDPETGDMGLPGAFTLAALNQLGYETENSDTETATVLQKADNPKDRGFDYWSVSENGAQIFQCKGQDKSIAECYASTISSGVADVGRIADYLSNLNSEPQEENRSIQKFRSSLKFAVESFYESESAKDEPFHIEIFLLIGAKDLTPQARTEFDAIKNNHPRISISGHECRCTFKLITLGDILGACWSEINPDWRTRSGEKREEITAKIQGDPIRVGNMRVFLISAYGLVKAKNDFGHQIFEQNVRCQIKKSEVNDAIKNQVASPKGMKEFQILNNGIVVIAQSVRLKSGTDKNPGEVKLLKPNIVNGLQTVSSLADIYDGMGEEKKLAFRKHCYVLARVFEKGSQIDVLKLVKATNTQNKMEARNLKSLDEAQKLYEARFAELGWFYQRKQGAWDAFKSDHRGWRSLQGYRPANFRGENGDRVADNIEVAQAWLAFIGFAEEAQQNKKVIFESEKMYAVAFELPPKMHASNLGFKFSNTDSDGEKQSPPAEGLLFAFLLWKTINAILPSKAEHRKACIRELKASGIIKDEDARREAQNQALSEYEPYLIGTIQRSWIFLFVELVGFILFRQYGDDWLKKFPEILERTDVKNIWRNRKLESIKEAYARKKRSDIKETDIVAKSLLLFESLVEHLVKVKDLGKRYNKTTGSRSRFLTHADRRTEIVERVVKLDALLRDQESLGEPWSAHAEKKQSLYKGIIDL